MATYPNEQYPADAVVSALDGTQDQATGLEYIARGTNAHSDPSYEVQYNRRLARQNGMLAVLRQGMVVDEGGLTIGVYPLRYTLGGVRKSFNGATGVAVSGDGTWRVYLDSSNVLQVAADFPVDVSSYMPLATVLVAGGQLTITDERALVLFGV